MEEQVIEKTSKAIERILKDGIATTNIDNLYKLIDIYKDAKEVENMNYGNYYGNYSGRGPGHGSYGEYGNYGDNYGRRGYDSKYRGYEHLDRMAGDYGRYTESRERYGAGEETDKSFHYMVKSLEDFIKVLHEEADTPQQKQQLRQALQNSMM